MRHLKRHLKLGPGGMGPKGQAARLQGQKDPKAFWGETKKNTHFFQC